MAQITLVRGDITEQNADAPRAELGDSGY